MGYVHLTDICQFIPPSDILKTAGTWTPTIASNLITDNRTAADANFDLLIPIVLPGSNIAKQGAKLVSIDLWFSIGTAAVTSLTAELNKVTLPATAVAATGAAITTTYDAGHDTAAERVTVASHKMNIALTTPAFIEDDEGYWLHILVEAAATSVFKLVGAQANFTLRL